MKSSLTSDVMLPPLLGQPQAGRAPTPGCGSHRALLALLLLSLIALSLAYQVPVTVELSQPAVVSNGFYSPEGRSSPQPYRWTNGQAQIWLAGLGRQPFHLVFTLSSARSAGEALPSVSVLANDAALGTFQATRPIRDYPFELGPDLEPLSGDLNLRIDSGTFVPPDDLRTLGVIVYNMRLESSAEPHLVIPAPLPLVWSLITISLFYLALRAWSSATGLVGLLSVFILAVLCLGIAAARLSTVAALPWAILLSTLLYVFAVPARYHRERWSLPF